MKTHCSDNFASVPITVEIESLSLRGDLVVPDGATGLVLFAHGSGSNRRSPRNRHVATILNDAGLATLLIDLLTEEEEMQDAKSGQKRFEIATLTERLAEIIDWLAVNKSTEGLKIGLFGASTGAAAAIVAATRRHKWIDAVVSRGGRPDLAGESLIDLQAPILFIVGSEDFEVKRLNQAAFEIVSGHKQLAIVKGATHLFEEPGTLDECAQLARNWFTTHLK